MRVNQTQFGYYRVVDSFSEFTDDSVLYSFAAV